MTGQTGFSAACRAAHALGECITLERLRARVGPAYSSEERRLLSYSTATRDSKASSAIERVLFCIGQTV